MNQKQNVSPEASALGLVSEAMRAAVSNRCPHCRKAQFFPRYLEPPSACEACSADFTEHQAGDGAVFIVMLILCFVTVGSVVALELVFSPPAWAHGLAALAVSLGLALPMLPLVKRFMVAQSFLNDAGA
ncbi:MAG: DUF983 domain-containing protein [Rhodobacteraceae bacterium]|nr:DUF983 domain-containing protein [Paracoccaceae bacterium]